MRKHHRNNLEKLAKFLRQFPSMLVFDMSIYAEAKNVDTALLPAEVKHTCGTNCCAAGSGPLAGIPAKQNEAWDPYVTRVFGADPNQDKGIWEFLFDPEWTGIQDTPLLAAKRIEYFLEHGVPKSFIKDIQNSDYDVYKAAFDVVDTKLRAYWKTSKARRKAIP